MKQHELVLKGIAAALGGLSGMRSAIEVGTREDKEWLLEWLPVREDGKTAILWRKRSNDEYARFVRAMVEVGEAPPVDSKDLPF